VGVYSRADKTIRLSAADQPRRSMMTPLRLTLILALSIGTAAAPLSTKLKRAHQRMHLVVRAGLLATILVALLPGAAAAGVAVWDPRFGGATVG
jgi:hypothetical protein